MIVKNLLRNAFVLSLLGGACITAQAQTYFKAGAGYSIGFNSAIDYQTDMFRTYDNNNISTQTRTFKRVNLNYGQGALAGLTLGHMFNPNIGAELTVGYLAGAKSSFKDTDVLIGNGQYPGGHSEQITNTYSRMLLLQPSLVFSAGREGFNPYTRFGFVAAIGSLNWDASYSDSDGDKFEMSQKYNGGCGFGFQGALGADYNLSPALTLFGELSFNNLAYAPTKGELTKYKVNGTDMLRNMQPRQKEVEFTDEYSESSIDNPSSSQPDSAPKTRYSMNGMGLMVGLKFKL